MPVPVVDPTAPPTLAKRIITPIGRTRAGKWVIMNVSTKVDPKIVKATRGRVSTLVFTPVVLLRHVGAKSGIERITPLLYFTDGERVILMASNFGQTRHPAWYHNVKAHPEVTLYAGGYEGRFIATETAGAERERLWDLATQFSVAYADYEHITAGRQIPVMALTPTG